MDEPNSSSPLSQDRRTERWHAERRQGELIAAGHESSWGWTTPAGRVRAERRARWITEQVGLRPGSRCLELGAGTGEFTARLAATGCVLTAFELSDVTAAICRERVDGDAEVVVGNIETGEGLEGREFDAIVGVSVLHHVDLAACFTHTFPHLRPGGRFAFSEPNMANPQIWLERRVNLVKRFRHVTPHETAFRAAELRRAFEAAGLVVETAEPFEFLHPAVPARAIDSLLRIEAVVERTALRRYAGSVRISGYRP
jgi:SAM-dependent methyltransferase